MKTIGGRIFFPFLSLLLLLYFVPAALLSGMDTGVGLRAMLTKGDNSSSLSLGPVVSFDFPLGDIFPPRASFMSGFELSVDIHSAVFIGSTAGLDLKGWYSPSIGAWRPRIGIGTGMALNDRVIYATSLDDFSAPPAVSWNAAASLDLFRFLFRRAGVSFLSIDVFTNLNGDSHEFGGAVTLFEFFSRSAAWNAPAQPAQPTASAETGEPATAAEPAQPAAEAQPTAPAETDEPAAAAEPIQPAAPRARFTAGALLDISALRMFGLATIYVPRFFLFPAVVLGYGDIRLQVSCNQLYRRDGWEDGPFYPALYAAVMLSPKVGWYRPQMGVGAWLTSLPASSPEDEWEIEPGDPPSTETDFYQSWFIRISPFRVGFDIGPVAIEVSVLDLLYGPIVPVTVYPGFRAVGDTTLGLNYGSVCVSYAISGGRK